MDPAGGPAELRGRAAARRRTLMVYVFERIDVIGAGRGELLEMLRSRLAPHLEEEYGVRLVGAWATVGSTGRWPEASALWEMDGWDHFARAQAARFPLEEKDPLGCELARHSLGLRAATRRALLAATAFSPGRERIRAERREGPVVLCESVEARSGRLSAYHDAVEAELLPLARARGVSLLGCFAHALRPNRGLALWSYPSWDDLARAMTALAEDAEWSAWERRRESLLRDAEAWLLARPPARRLGT